MISPDPRAVLAAACLGFVTLCHADAARAEERQGSSGRAMTTEDLLGIQSVDDVELSADGAWVATTVIRPRRPGEYYRVGLDSAQRADVWVSPSAGGPSINVTRGERDAAGYWSASWSPDGRYLAMLSTQGADNVRLYVWDRTTRKLRRLAEEGVDLEALFHMPDAAEPSVIAWQSAHTLFAVLLPVAHKPVRFHEVEGSGEIEAKAAAAVLRGRGPTAVAWSSGNGPATFIEPQLRGSFVSIDVRSGRRQVLAQLPIAETRIAHRMITLSPGGRFAAISLPGEPKRPSATTALRLELYYPRRLGLVALDGTDGLQWVANVCPITFDSGNSRDALRWSTDEDSLALIGVQPDGDSAVPRIFVVDARSHSIHRVIEPQDPAGGLVEFENLRWTATGQLVAAARPHSIGNAIISNDPINRRHDDAPGAQVPAEWWLIDPSGKLSRSHAAQPVDESRRKWQSVLSSLPHGSATYFSRAANALAYVTRDTRVYAMSLERPKPVELLSLNRAMDEVERPRHISFEYQSMDGRKLSATVLLPLGYVAGKRYPLIVDVYGGEYAATAGLAERDERYQGYYLNPLLLASRGYAVLTPSIPLAPMGAASDPLLDIDKGVEPALAKAIEMGLADANRIGVMGASYGGYTTLGLIARSTRFRAAVALAGAYDLISLYGRTDHRYLYRPDSYAARGPYGAESFQMRMGLPLWRDVERYWRNSPLAYAEQIQTPLLLIHGTVDNLPVTQSEELFASLNRLGKRVDFVRYVGEEHAVESPDNIRDLWGRICAWFEEFL